MDNGDPKALLSFFFYFAGLRFVTMALIFCVPCGVPVQPPLLFSNIMVCWHRKKPATRITRIIRPSPPKCIWRGMVDCVRAERRCVSYLPQPSTGGAIVGLMQGGFTLQVEQGGPRQQAGRQASRQQQQAIPLGSCFARLPMRVSSPPCNRKQKTAEGKHRPHVHGWILGVCSCGSSILSFHRIHF